MSRRALARPSPRRRAALLAVAGALAAGPTGCGEGEGIERASDREASDARRPPGAPPVADQARQRFPHLLNVRPIRMGPHRYAFMVMVSSPYDSPRRFADGWRVLTPQGAVLAEKRLGHPHPDEQPFWRRQSEVRVPPGVDRVLFEGHDSRNGYGGRRLTVTLP